MFPLGLETFSQLVYEDDYGAVRDYDDNLDVFWLHGMAFSLIYSLLKEKHQCNINQWLPQISASGHPAGHLSAFPVCQSHPGQPGESVTSLQTFFSVKFAHTMFVCRKPWQWTRLTYFTGTLWTIHPFLTSAKLSHSWARRLVLCFVFFFKFLSFFCQSSLFLLLLAGSVSPIHTCVHTLWCEDGDWICPSERHSCHPRVWHTRTHSVLGQRWVLNTIQKCF